MKIRSMIHAGKGKLLVSCDLSQAETWIVAHLANDENMKHALKFDDIHSTTAKGIFTLPDVIDDGVKLTPKQMYKKGLIDKKQRYSGKKTNHGTSYMMGPMEFTFSYNEEVDDPINVATAKKFQKTWHDLYPGVKNTWWPNVERELFSNAGMLVTPYNRRITFFGPVNSYIKEAVACVPQSTVADHFRGREQKYNPIPGGLKEINKKLPQEANIIQQGHDSALIECPKEIAYDVIDIMKKCLFRPIIINGEEVWIPVDGELGEDWGNLEEVK